MDPVAICGPLAIGDVHPRDDRKVHRHLIRLRADDRGCITQFNGGGCGSGSPTCPIRPITRLPRSVLGTNLVGGMVPGKVLPICGLTTLSGNLLR